LLALALRFEQDLHGFSEEATYRIGLAVLEPQPGQP
jgi:hypothetical protein